MPAVHSFRISAPVARLQRALPRFALRCATVALITSKHPQWLESRLEQPCIVWGWGWLEARTTLTDKQWALIEPVLPGRTGDPGRSGNNNRMSLEGMIWITRTGAPWRDLPQEFGNWNTVHRRFRRWVQSGVFQRVFDVTEGDLDLKTVMVDGTFAKVHQHGTGAKKAVARLRNRLSGRLSAVVEAGLPPSSWPWLTRPDASSGSR